MATPGWIFNHLRCDPLEDVELDAGWRDAGPLFGRLLGLGGHEVGQIALDGGAGWVASLDACVYHSHRERMIRRSPEHHPPALVTADADPGLGHQDFAQVEQLASGTV